MNTPAPDDSEQYATCAFDDEEKRLRALTTATLDDDGRRPAPPRQTIDQLLLELSAARRTRIARPPR
jgi:hypothetical protein